MKENSEIDVKPDVIDQVHSNIMVTFLSQDYFWIDEGSTNISRRGRFAETVPDFEIICERERKKKQDYIPVDLFKRQESDRVRSFIAIILAPGNNSQKSLNCISLCEKYINFLESEITHPTLDNSIQEPRKDDHTPQGDVQTIVFYWWSKIRAYKDLGDDSLKPDGYGDRYDGEKWMRIVCEENGFKTFSNFRDSYNAIEVIQEDNKPPSCSYATAKRLKYISKAKEMLKHEDHNEAVVWIDLIEGIALKKILNPVVMIDFAFNKTSC